MAYDGSTWDESNPQDSTVANTIDDHIQDVKKGVRARLALEHVMPASQAATASGGRHLFVSFVHQTVAPTIPGTAGVVWVGTDKALYFTNSAGTDAAIIGTNAKIPVIAGGTLGSIALCSSANPTGLTVLAGSVDGLYLRTATNTGAPTWGNPLTDHFKVSIGTAVHGETIAPPAGFLANQCAFFVGLKTVKGSGLDQHDTYIMDITCTVDAGGVVTATNARGSATTCVVNFMIVATK